MNSMNVVNDGFSSARWVDMIIQASESRNTDRPLFICRQFYSKDNRCLQLETNEQIQQSWRGNWRKVPLNEMLNITRICLLNNPDQTKNTRLGEALTTLASRTERKYAAGFIGLVRRVIAAFWNIYVSDSVSLFGTGTSEIVCQVFNRNYDYKYMPPFFMGNNANFSRWIVDHYLS